jgi:DNA phosphorothioation-dependent restriction protein DptG
MGLQWPHFFLQNILKFVRYVNLLYAAQLILCIHFTTAKGLLEYDIILKVSHNKQVTKTF